jgi:hypothetical protein
MPTEHIFIEEYRKELSGTGYPFTTMEPLEPDTGHTLPLGAIADVSIYCERTDTLPVITSITRSGNLVTFKLNLGSEATADFINLDEVLEFYSDVGVFYGILVIDIAKFKAIAGWKNGEHVLVKPYHFCPRCLSVMPPIGVQRFRTDTNKIVSGNIAFAGLKGTILRLLKTEQDHQYIEVNFIGDPAYTVAESAEENKLPIGSILVTDDFDNRVKLLPDELGGVKLIATNTERSNLETDALRFETIDNNKIKITLGSK